MKTLFSSRALFAMGFILVVATNAWVLGSVFLNRSGAPDCRVLLTEREAPLRQWGMRENSGLSLQLVWQVLNRETSDTPYFGPWGSPAWFDTAKLRALGFDVEGISRREHHYEFHKEPIPREVFIVLEYDGESFQTALKSMESALEKKRALLAQQPADKANRMAVQNEEKRLQRERTAGSRLYAVDAGLDPRSLRAAYPDRSRFIIAKGVVSVSSRYVDKKMVLCGDIKRISINRIHLSLGQAKELGSILKSKGRRLSADTPPRYSVELVYGHRHEPWIAAINALR